VVSEARRVVEEKLAGYDFELDRRKSDELQRIYDRAAARL
jgi:hypothetical protein